MNSDELKYELIYFELGNMPIIIFKCKNGYLANTYINYTTSEKVGDVAGFVMDVKTPQEFMNAKLRYVTSWAKKIGLKEGMSVKRAIKILNK